jgi:hypothetical protein
MGEQGHALTDRAALRRILREYIRWTLYASISHGNTPALPLPQLKGARLTEADIYLAQPGPDDPRVDERGRPQPRHITIREGSPTIGYGATQDHIAAKVAHLDGWRAYLERELAYGRGTFHFERERVMAHVQRLSPRHQQAIWDIGHRSTAEAALYHRCSLAAIKVANRDALDTLLGILYASVGQRIP